MMLFICQMNPVILILVALMISGTLFFKGKEYRCKIHDLESIKNLDKLSQIKILKDWERESFEDDDEENTNKYRSLRYELEEQIRLEKKNLK